MSAPIDPDQTAIPATEVTPKMSYKQLAGTIAATTGILGLGSGGALEGLDYTLVSDTQITAYQTHIESLEADKELLLRRADERVSNAAMTAESEIARCLSAQAAIRGQLCEYQRANGHLLPDANCWGLER